MLGLWDQGQSPNVQQRNSNVSRCRLITCEPLSCQTASLDFTAEWVKDERGPFSLAQRPEDPSVWRAKLQITLEPRGSNMTQSASVWWNVATKVVFMSKWTDQDEESLQLRDEWKAALGGKWIPTQEISCRPHDSGSTVGVYVNRVCPWGLVWSSAGGLVWHIVWDPGHRFAVVMNGDEDKDPNVQWSKYKLLPSVSIQWVCLPRSQLLTRLLHLASLWIIICVWTGSSAAMGWWLGSAPCGRIV